MYRRAPSQYEKVDEKILRLEHEHLLRNKALCEKILDLLNEEYERNKKEREEHKGTQFEYTCGSWNNKLFEMGNVVRENYKKISDVLVYNELDDKFYGGRRLGIAYV